MSKTGTPKNPKAPKAPKAPVAKKIKSQIPEAKKAVAVLVKAGVLASSDAKTLLNKIRKNLI